MNVVRPQSSRAEELLDPPILDIHRQKNAIHASADPLPRTCDDAARGLSACSAAPSLAVFVSPWASSSLGNDGLQHQRGAAAAAAAVLGGRCICELR
eukprot:COSAG02_NODE_1432_length_12646_cov_3.566988_4_plen_97_part_00